VPALNTYAIDGMMAALLCIGKECPSEWQSVLNKLQEVIQERDWPQARAFLTPPFAWQRELDAVEPIAPEAWERVLAALAARLRALVDAAGGDPTALLQWVEGVQSAVHALPPQGHGGWMKAFEQFATDVYNYQLGGVSRVRLLRGARDLEGRRRAA
jgi:hypothetical protein